MKVPIKVVKIAVGNFYGFYWIRNIVHILRVHKLPIQLSSNLVRILCATVRQNLLILVNVGFIIFSIGVQKRSTIH